MKILNFKIGTKLIVGFIVVIAIFGAAIYYQILTLQNLADILGIQSRHLSQIINDKYKQNFYDYINSYRIHAAKEKLADSTDKKTILEILYAVGFNTKSSFNTAFMKHTGLTPTKFREMTISATSISKPE